MKSFFRKLTGLLPCLLLAGFCAHAQYQPDSLIVMSKAVYDGNKVILRWVPHNFETWQWGLTHGYRLERVTLKSNGTDLAIGPMINSKVVLDSLVIPWPEMEWEAMADTNDMAGTAAGVIYGDSMEVISYNEAGFTDVVNLNKERENRFSFALFAADNSFQVAEAMGIGYEDPTAVAGMEYLYNVEINNAPASTVARKGTTTVETASGGSFPAPQNLVAAPGDKSVLLAWNSEDLGEHYTSYCVEYSSDGGNTFLPAHDLPLVFGEQRSGEAANAAFQDSLDANGVTYIYRVKGKSPFGAMGPWSDTVHVVGKPASIGVNPGATLIEEVNEGKLTITWEFPQALESKINGFDVHRSDKVDGTYTKINTSLLSVTTRFFEDPNPGITSNYYKVKSEDENGYTLSSNALLGQLKDSIPPAAPVGLVGESDNNGLVTLTWNKNTEEDLMGYRVFMSNVSNGEFAQITVQWINDTTFQYQINLNTLSEHVYFAVKAIDFRQNPSDRSAPVSVDRPDIIPPSPPSISKVTAGTGRVNFEWELSSSPDARDYKFERKPNGAPGWVTLLDFDKQAPVYAFTDTTASIHRYWDYRLSAIDEVGLIGYSRVIKAKPVDNGIRDTIADFSGYLNPSQTQDAVPSIQLGWNYITDPDLEGFEIYRAIDNNDMRAFAFISYSDSRSYPSQQLGTYLGFLDYDTDFKKVPVQGTYTANTLDFNTVVTGGTVYTNGSTTTVVPQILNVPNNPQGGVTLRYWIIAKYMDGATSPLSNEVMIQIP